MRDINQKASNTDKQITLALLRSVWLSYLLSVGSISAGALSIFSATAILGTEPAHANLSEQSGSLPDQTTQEEQANPISSCSSEPNCSAGTHEELLKEEAFQTAEADVPTIPENTDKSDTLNLSVSDPPVELTANASCSSSIDKAEAECTKATHRLYTGQLEQTVLAPTHHSVGNALGQSATLELPVFTPNSEQEATEFTFASPELAQVQPNKAAEAIIDTGVGTNSLSLKPVRTTTEERHLLAQFPTEDKLSPVPKALVSSPPAVAPTLSPVEYNQSEQWMRGNEPIPIHPDLVSSPPAVTPALSSVERNQTEQLALGDKPTTAHQLAVPSLSTDAPAGRQIEPATYSGPGAASLLGGTIRAQSFVDDEQEPSSRQQNAPLAEDPLAPSLVLQGGFITQGGTGARARLTGLYPISPNALFGGTVDLTTGEGFSDTEGTGLDINELYFTGSLPSYPNLRLTVGLMDLTSYFDRNSFAKDSLTHFFNPVFQTNPALAAAGIGSRPGALLNWDITDNIQARAAAFSSDRDIGDFDLDAFAGELAFRFGNAIVRGTFSTNKDAGRNNGFEEIYEIPRGNGNFGLDSDDRENAYGINAEYFIPGINMGLFARYGHYENTDLDEGGDTYSLGLSFLDLFMRDDRLGFGYGRNLSNNDLRRERDNKVPDVWEVFYDFRVTSYLRAGVSLQARDEFSDVVAGFRVRTDFDILGRLFR